MPARRPRVHAVSAPALAGLALSALSPLVACGGDDGDLVPPNPDEAAVETCVKVINDFRATLSLPPYTRWSTEESCASQEAAMDAASDTVHDTEGTCTEDAQNECPGWAGPTTSMITPCLDRMWAEGPGTDLSTHGNYLNLSSTTYTMVACGFKTVADGTTWATQDFQ